MEEIRGRRVETPPGEKRGNETGKVGIVHGSVEPTKRHQLALPTSRKNPCTDARRTETCVAPRHVDASCDFYFILPERAALGGRAVRCQTFLFFSFSCSADHERDWLPCKVVISGWQPIR